MPAIDWSFVIRHASVYALVSSRVLGLCLTAPALAIPGVDWRFRLVLVVLLGAVLTPVVAVQFVPPADWLSAAWATPAEVLTGGFLGLSAALIVAGARLAGDLMAGQAGLATAALLDPETGEETTPLGRFYGLIALVVFLLLDGPLVLIRALVESYAEIPMGRFLISYETATLALGQVGHALELGLRAAAPAALALVLATIVLGWLGRAASASPLVALALPIRAIIGIMLVLLSLTTLVVLLANTWAKLRWVS
jgi:flagellar biosynthesis protein FliR